jgi:hypothetical protein
MEGPTRLSRPQQRFQWDGSQMFVASPELPTTLLRIVAVRSFEIGVRRKTLDPELGSLIALHE